MTKFKRLKVSIFLWNQINFGLSFLFNCTFQFIYLSVQRQRHGLQCSFLDESRVVKPNKTRRKAWKNIFELENSFGNICMWTKWNVRKTWTGFYESLFFKTWFTYINLKSFVKTVRARFTIYFYGKCREGHQICDLVCIPWFKLLSGAFHWFAWCARMFFFL